MNISKLITKQWTFDKHGPVFSSGLDIDLNSWGLGFEIGLPKPNEWKFYIGFHILCVAFYFGAG